MAKKGKAPAGKSVEAHRHAEARRRDIPTAEYQSVIQRRVTRFGRIPSTGGRGGRGGRRRA